MIIIIGGTSDIGQATFHILKNKGFKVGLVSRQPLQADSGYFFQAEDYSLASLEKALRYFNDIETITGILHCPGSILLKPLHLLSEAEFLSTFQINVFSAFNALQAALKVVQKDFSVALFSSAAAQIGLPNHEAISAAKGAVEGLMRATAATYAPKGIRVNCIAPGLVNTKLSANITKSQAALDLSTALHPIRRIGMPEDVASVAALLLDPACTWITGSVITVDGGLSSLKSYPSRS